MKTAKILIAMIMALQINTHSVQTLRRLCAQRKFVAAGMMAIAGGGVYAHKSDKPQAWVLPIELDPTTYAPCGIMSNLVVKETESTQTLHIIELQENGKKSIRTIVANPSIGPWSSLSSDFPLLSQAEALSPEVRELLAWKILGWRKFFYSVHVHISSASTSEYDKLELESQFDRGTVELVDETSESGSKKIADAQKRSAVIVSEKLTPEDMLQGLAKREQDRNKASNLNYSYWQRKLKEFQESNKFPIFSNGKKAPHKLDRGPGLSWGYDGFGDSSDW